MPKSIKLGQWSIFADRYYWLTTILIARSHLSKQYRNSFLGIIWSLLTPLSMAIVYAIIMPLIMHFRVENYPLYIVCTLPLWGFISTALIGANLSLLNQAETLKRCMISTTVFPIADILRHSYTYFVAFLSMYTVIILMGYPFSWHVLLLPLYFIPVMITVAGAAIGIAYAAPYVRDVGEALAVLMAVLAWFSCVVYPFEAIPPVVQNILVWNPFYMLMQPAIDLIYYERFPDVITMVKLFSVMLLSLGTGYSFYRLCRRNYVYYL